MPSRGRKTSGWALKLVFIPLWLLFMMICFFVILHEKYFWCLSIQNHLPPSSFCSLVGCVQTNLSEAQRKKRYVNFLVANCTGKNGRVRITRRNTNHIIPWKTKETYSGRWKNKPFTTTPIKVKNGAFVFILGEIRKFHKIGIERKNQSRTSVKIAPVFDFAVFRPRRQPQRFGSNNREIAASIIQKSSLIARIHFPHQHRQLREVALQSLLHPWNNQGNSRLSLQERTTLKTWFPGRIRRHREIVLSLIEYFVGLQENQEAPVLTRHTQCHPLLLENRMMVEMQSKGGTGPRMAVPQQQLLQSRQTRWWTRTLRVWPGL